VRPSKPIQAIDRALDVLELVANAPNGVNLCSLSDGLGLKRQTVYSIAMTLTRRGYLRKDYARRTYMLGPVMAALRARQARWNSEVLRPSVLEVQRLCRDSEGTVMLGQYSRVGIIARLVVRPKDWLSPRYYYGLVIQPYGTAVLYQAFMNEEQLAEYRRRFPLDEHDYGFWRSYELLDEFLCLIRNLGYLALYRNGLRVAAPVFDAGGAMAAMVCVAKPTAIPTKESAERLIEMVRRAATNISAKVAKASRHQPSWPVW